MYNKQEIINFVERFRKYLQDKTGGKQFLSPPYSPEEALKLIGGRAEYRDWKNQLADGRVKPEKPFEERRFLVELPHSLYPLREKFTIAHEIGHIMLHFFWPNPEKWVETCKKLNKEDNLSMYRGQRTCIEYEANLFAACFLMPEPEFSEVFERISKECGEDGYEVRTQTEKKVAEHFGVSVYAARTRAQFVGLLPW
nr:hypothetical protein 3 [bacterium]